MRVKMRVRRDTAALKYISAVDFLVCWLSRVGIEYRVDERQARIQISSISARSSCNGKRSVCSIKDGKVK